VAAVQLADDCNRVTCDVPDCLTTRMRRGQGNGRWLFNVMFSAGKVIITTRCHECGATHSVLFPIPAPDE